MIIRNFGDACVLIALCAAAVFVAWIIDQIPMLP